jgi:hypothetical protein
MYEILMYNVKCYLPIWGLNNLDFSGYNMIHPDFPSLGAFLALSQADEGLEGLPNQYF